MRMRSFLIAATTVVALAAAPATAADFSLFGSYWDTDAAGDAGGAGLGLMFPVGDVFGIDLRATYFEELSDDPLANAFDSDDPVFQEQGINVWPVEAGVRLRFAQDTAFRPYVGAGFTYYRLDSDFGEISDEVGYYGLLGATIGDGEGADFMVEGTWRKATAEVELDPEDLEDIDDIDIEDHAEFDLDGLGVNLGVVWHF
jgi:hypothetical protein